MNMVMATRRAFQRLAWAWCVGLWGCPADLRVADRAGDAAVLLPCGNVMGLPPLTFPALERLSLLARSRVRDRQVSAADVRALTVTLARLKVTAGAPGDDLAVFRRVTFSMQGGEGATATVPIRVAEGEGFAAGTTEVLLQATGADLAALVRTGAEVSLVTHVEMERCPNAQMALWTDVEWEVSADPDPVKRTLTP